MTDNAPLVQELSHFGGTLSFHRGDVLRLSGGHYRDMYIVLKGQAAVLLQGATEGTPTNLIGVDEPIGEICFLQGTAANATVIAASDLKVLRIDDDQLERISKERPQLAAQLLQNLARTADVRLSQNSSILADADFSGVSTGLEIILCRSDALLEQAKKLRYAVYCGELGRKSPNANHKTETISDGLDETGYCFLAQKDGETIATLRVNYACDGPLNELEPIYGMTRSPHFPGNCGICTKFIVDRQNRGGPAAMMLIAQAVQLGRRDNMKECYIDCIPDLLDYYSALGFETSAPEFLHPENGLSIPMKLDLESHGDKMSGRDGLKHMVRMFLKSRAKKKRMGQ